MKQNPHLQTQLTLPVYPAILDKRVSRELLGFTEEEYDALIAAGHVSSLGKPRARTQKRFATALILELRDDVQWLSEAQDIIRAHWRKLNTRKKQRRITSTP